MISLRRALMALAFLAPLPAAAHDGIHISDPYARILNGSGVIYMQIDNHSDQPDALIAARAEIGAAMLMTNTEDENGMMQMRMVMDGFPIDPAGSRLLRSAGDHVMLSDVTTPPEQGATFTLILTFRHAGEVTVQVPLDNTRRTDPGPGPTPFDASSGQ